MKMKNNIKNTRNGYHFNSYYWQNWKKSLPDISYKQYQIILGMVLSDANMYLKNKYPFVKFEQGYSQKEFIYNLFEECKPYTFMEEPSIRYENGKIKSYWFKTFSHSTFNKIWDITYENNKKIIKKKYNYK